MNCSIRSVGSSLSSLPWILQVRQFVMLSIYFACLFLVRVAALLMAISDRTVA